MTAPDNLPDINPNSSYPIGEAAKMIGITARHLLRLAVGGEIKFTICRRYGRKRFSGRELIRFRNL